MFDLFSALYCFLIFVCTYKHTKIIDIIGKLLSPIKLILFFVLIIFGLFSPSIHIAASETVTESFKRGLVNGYGTMDLLAAFFFCSVIYQHIFNKIKLQGITDTATTIRIFLMASLIGGLLLGLVYTGFILVGAKHALPLEHVATAEMIMVVSHIVLGKLGSLFVCICVGLACLVTAIALTEIATIFCYERLFSGKLPRNFCLICVVALTYSMSIMGFAGIMKIALPMLEILYPALILYCIFNIVTTLSSLRKKATQPSEPSFVTH